MSRRQLSLKGASRGFTLIELLVAFVILTLSMTAVYAIFSTGLSGLALSQDFSRAALLGESHLAAVGVVATIDDAERAGRFDDKYDWQLQVTPLSEPTFSAVSGNGPPQPALYRLALTVSWHRAGRERALLLETLRVGYPDTLWSER